MASSRWAAAEYAAALILGNLHVKSQCGADRSAYDERQPRRQTTFVAIRLA